MNVAGGGFGAAFVFLEEDEVDLFGLDVGDKVGDFAFGEEDVDGENAEVWLTFGFGKGEMIGVEEWNGKGDQDEGEQLELSVSTLE